MSPSLGSLAGLFQRRQACTLVTWIVALYDRILNSKLGSWLPFRRRIVQAWLKGYDEPFHVRLGTSDWMVLDELFIRCGYNFVFEDNITNCRLVLDLGANVGFSMRLWAEAYPDATIVGVEPDESNIAICQVNLQRYKERCLLVNAFIGGTNRLASLDRNGMDWSFTMAKESGCTEGQILVRTIPELLANYNLVGEIDLLKCDIEGAEEEVFLDCSEWISRVRCIAVELHGSYDPPRFLEDIERSGGKFESYLISTGESYSIMFLHRKS